MLPHLENIFQDVRKYLLGHGYRKTSIVGTNIKSNDVSSEFDIGAEKIAIDYCRKHNLPVEIWSEETGKTAVCDKPEFLLIIDPCDGSTNFKSWIEGSAFSVACMPFGNSNPASVRYALIGSIISGAVIKAERGKGTFYKGPFSGFNEINVSTSTNTDIYRSKVEIDLDFGLNEASGETRNKELMKRVDKLMRTGIKNIRRNGSAALGLSYIATGSLDSFVDVRDISTPENWMAAYLLITEAGGVFTDAFGNRMGNVDFTKPYSYVASGNEKIHKAILERLDMSDAKC